MNNCWHFEELTDKILVGKMVPQKISMTKSFSTKLCIYTIAKFVLVSFLFCSLCLDGVLTFNVDTKNVKVFQGPSGMYFGYSLAMLRNMQGNWWALCLLPMINCINYLLLKHFNMSIYYIYMYYLTIPLENDTRDTRDTRDTLHLKWNVW